MLAACLGRCREKLKDRRSRVDCCNAPRDDLCCHRKSLPGRDSVSSPISACVRCLREPLMLSSIMRHNCNAVIENARKSHPAVCSAQGYCQMKVTPDPGVNSTSVT